MRLWWTFWRFVWHRTLTPGRYQCECGFSTDEQYKWYAHLFMHKGERKRRYSDRM